MDKWQNELNFFANPVLKNSDISKSWSSWSKILTYVPNDWPVDPVDFAFSPQVHFKTSCCFSLRDWNPEQVRSKGRIGVGAREGKGVRAFVIIHNQHLVFLREKKSLQKSQMMDPVALLHGNILLGIFYSFQTFYFTEL